MRHFKCLTFEVGSECPAITLIPAANEARARRLVLAELHSNKHAVSVDIYDENILLWTERA